MSPIGRIFIILNLILAAAFLGWASTSLAKGAEYRDQFQNEQQAHSTTREELEAERARLQTELNQERTAKEALRAEKEQQSALALRNKEDLDAAKRANEQLRADITKIQETLAGYGQTIQSLEASKDQAVAGLREAEQARDAAMGERDTSVTAQRDAEDALKQAQAAVADLERQLKTARDEVSSLDTKLKTLVAHTGVNIKDFTDQPQLEARVLQVDRDLKPGLVALSIGSKAGVQRGFTFEIYDGQVYKGRVRVESVYEDMSSALIINEVPNARIQQGDRASTRL